MISFILKRLAEGVLVIWGIVSLLFLIFSVLGDPSEAIKSQRSDLATDQAIKKMYYLDKSVPVQYLLYLNDLSPIALIDKTGPNFEGYSFITLFQAGEKHLFVLKTPYLRRSFQTNRKVSEVILQKLPGTFILALFSIVLASFLGIFLGVWSSIKMDTWVDKALVFISMLGISAPSFFIGILIMRIFSVDLGEYTGLNVTGYLFEPKVIGEGVNVHWKNLILPAMALGIRPLAIIMQLTRSSMLEVISMDYIRTARSKGLSEQLVLFRHGLRNALNPVITSISGWFASLLAGAFFIEYIFGWQGIGKLMIDALSKKDFPVILGCALTVGIIFVLVNIVVDILYTKLDPRIKLTS